MADFTEAERKIYSTDNRVAAGYDVARLNSAAYKAIVDKLFNEDYSGIATAQELKTKPSLKPYLDRYRSDMAQRPERPKHEAAAGKLVKELLSQDSIKEMMGICNAWATMWIWNSYDNVNAIEDQPPKILCKAFQKYFQTTSLIAVVKGHDSPTHAADEKFMAKLKGYTGTFGLQIDAAVSESGAFPVSSDDRFHGAFSTIAGSIRNAILRNQGVGFKLTITLDKHAHAIGFFARGPEAIYLFDPNYGLFRYNNPDGFQSDIYTLFFGRGHPYRVKGLSRWTLHGLKKL